LPLFGALSSPRAKVSKYKYVFPLATFGSVTLVEGGVVAVLLPTVWMRTGGLVDDMGALVMLARQRYNMRIRPKPGSVEDNGTLLPFSKRIPGEEDGVQFVHVS
jgi:hypothetical protein